MNWKSSVTLPGILSLLLLGTGVSGSAAPAQEVRMSFQAQDELQNDLINAGNLKFSAHPAGRNDGGSLRLVNKSRELQFLSIRCGEIPAGEGIFISLWVKTTMLPKADLRSSLSLKSRSSAQKPVYASLSSVPLQADKWTLLSGWYYHRATDGQPEDFKVSVEPGVELLMDDLHIVRSSTPHPPVERSFIQVRGAELWEGEAPVLLHGVNFYGCSDDEAGDTKHQTATVLEDDYQQAAAAGFNCVRLSLWHKVFREDGGWEWLKLHFLWAKRHGLRLILDMHSPPGGYQSNDYKGVFWKNPKMQEELRDFWVRAAHEFKDDPVVAAFDLMNEPKPPKESDWLAYAGDTLKTLRANGWNRPVIVESSMTQEVDGWSLSHQRFDDESVIYDTHFYTPWSFTSSGSTPYGEALPDYGKRNLDAGFLRERLDAELLAFGRKYKVPVNIGEFGVSEKSLAVGGEKWLAAILGLLNEHQVSRQYFCWCVYGDFAIEPGWFRHSPPVRVDGVLTLLRNARPQPEHR